MLAGMETDAGLSALTPRRAQRPRHEAGAGRHDRQEPRLDQQLTRDRGAARAEGRPQRDLLLAIDRASQQQLADIDAGDQQDDADRGEQQQERGARRADDRFQRRLGLERVPGLRGERRRGRRGRFGAGGLDAPADHVEVGARPGDADACLQPRHAKHHRPGGMQPARGRELGGGNEQIDAEVVAIGWHRVGIERRRDDADHGERHAIQRHRGANRRRIAVETPLPRLVRDHHDRLHRTGSALFFGEEAAALRLQPQHVEKRSCRKRAGETLRFVHAGQVDALWKEQGHRVDDAALPDLFVFEIGEQPARKRRRSAPDVDDPIGVRIRQRPQQHGVDDAEHRGVGADAERQRQDGDHRKRGRRRHSRSA